MPFLYKCRHWYSSFIILCVENRKYYIKSTIQFGSGISDSWREVGEKYKRHSIEIQRLICIASLSIYQKIGVCQGWSLLVTPTNDRMKYLGEKCIFRGNAIHMILFFSSDDSSWWYWNIKSIESLITCSKHSIQYVIWNNASFQPDSVLKYLQLDSIHTQIQLINK